MVNPYSSLNAQYVNHTGLSESSLVLAEDSVEVVRGVAKLSPRLEDRPAALLAHGQRRAGAIADGQIGQARRHIEAARCGQGTTFALVMRILFMYVY